MSLMFLMISILLTGDIIPQCTMADFDAVDDRVRIWPYGLWFLTFVNLYGSHLEGFHLFHLLRGKIQVAPNLP